MYHSNLTSTQT